MHFKISRVFLFVLIGMWTAQTVQGQVAKDFPPGVFNDGRRYSLDALRGRVVVLFFYEKNCPRCAESIPNRNALVKKYRNAPVQFIAVAAGDSFAEVESYVSRTGLAMPVFVDSVSLMERRYGFTISLQNIWQFRVIDAHGNVIGHSMDEATIDQALATVKLKWSADEYDAKLKPVIDRLNAEDYKSALRGLTRATTDRDAAVKASATKLMEAVLAEGQAWKAQADGLADEDVLAALALYERTANTFANQTFGQEAEKAMRMLLNHPAVKDEKAAQQMYARMEAGVARMDQSQLGELIKFARSISKQYPQTPTGKKAEALVADLTEQP